MEMVKDEVIRRIVFRWFKKVSWDSSFRRWFIQQENIVMMDLKNPIETKNLKWTIFWWINIIYFGVYTIYFDVYTIYLDVYISKFM
jgi:hypothetical protein